MVVSSLDPANYASGIYTLKLEDTQTNDSSTIQVALENPVVQVTSLPPASVSGQPPTISANTPLSIIAADPDGSPVSWTLSLLSASTKAVVATLASGNSSAGLLPGYATQVATFNPSLYANGKYILSLAASTSSTSEDTFYWNATIDIATAIKTGALVLPATDGTFATAAGNIQITRTYNSANTSLTSYFGPGWTLGLLDAQLSTTAEADTLNTVQGATTLSPATSSISLCQTMENMFSNSLRNS